MFSNDEQFGETKINESFLFSQKLQINELDNYQIYELDYQEF